MPDPAARLIYHPRRERRAFGPAVVYFDRTAGNQDPYVWNEAFLHSYCHITQFHAEAGDINLWVSGDRFAVQPPVLRPAVRRGQQMPVGERQRPAPR